MVYANTRLANGKQLLSELIIHQAPTAPYLPVISLRFPLRLSSIWIIPATRLAEGVLPLKFVTWQNACEMVYWQ